MICPLCDCPDWESVEKNKDGVNIRVQCRNCEFIYPTHRRSFSIDPASRGKFLLTVRPSIAENSINRMLARLTPVMDLANDERIKRLNELIQQETDRDKVLVLAEELVRLLDGHADVEPPESVT
jgi:hypothetical protein